jgi:hypothetical protein
MDTAAPNGEQQLLEDSLRLMKAFSKIADPKIRAEIIGVVENRVDDISPHPPRFELDPRD